MLLKDSTPLTEIRREPYPRYKGQGRSIEVGVDDAEGPPVPIPNTEVKLSGADNSGLATGCEDREMPTP